jgi:hypothetical protein
MQRWFGALVLFLFAATARADVIDTRPAEGPVAEPKTIASELKCQDEGDGVELVLMKSSTIAGTKVEILHPCSSDFPSQLAIRTKRGWFTSSGFEFSRANNHHSVDQSFVKLLDESITAGKSSDGSTAIVYRSIVREEDTHCVSPEDCKPYDTHQVASVMICELSGDSPRCGTTRYTCPTKGCGSATFVDGTLSVTVADGTKTTRRDFVVKNVAKQ